MDPEKLYGPAEQYIPILGKTIKISKDVMVVNPDAKFLYNHLTLKGREEVLDIGTGNGILALVAAKLGASRVVATDINPEAVANAKENAKILGFEKTIEVRQVSQENPEAFSIIKSDKRFDLIVSNPPYTPGNKSQIINKRDYAEIDVDGVLIKTIFANAKDHLKDGGSLLIAYGWGLAAKNRIQKLAEEYGFDCKFIFNRKYDTFICHAHPKRKNNGEKI